MRRPFTILASLSLLLCLANCRRNSAPRPNHDQVVANVKGTVAVVKQFAGLSSPTHHFISYFGSANATWVSKAGLHDRYVLTMQFPIELDYKTGQVIKAGAPQFWLNEVISVQGLGHGAFDVRYGQNKTFGLETWTKITEGSTFEEVGITLKKDQPVTGFDKVWRTG